MPWSPVIVDIVDQATLNQALSGYVRSTDNTAALNSKLNRTGDTATNLKLIGGSTANDDAATVLYVNNAISGFNASLGSKANTANPTFTGTVTVPDGVSPTSAVNLGQLQGYLPLSGGTVTGPITVQTAPSNDFHLTNRLYVNNAINTLENQLLDDFVQRDTPFFTAIAHGLTPPNTAFGDELTTAEWVRTLVEPGALQAGTFASDESVDAKLELFAPKHGAELSGSPTIIGELPLEDDSNKIPTTAWVQALINDRLGTL